MRGIIKADEGVMCSLEKLLTTSRLWSIIQNTCYMMYLVSDRCTGCGTCLDVCPVEAIRIEDGRAKITIECMDCGACLRVCPEGAIRKQAAAVVPTVK